MRLFICLDANKTARRGAYLLLKNSNYIRNCDVFDFCTWCCWSLQSLRTSCKSITDLCFICIKPILISIFFYNVNQAFIDNNLTCGVFISMFIAINQIRFIGIETTRPLAISVPRTRPFWDVSSPGFWDSSAPALDVSALLFGTLQPLLFILYSLKLVDSTKPTEGGKDYTLCMQMIDFSRGRESSGHLHLFFFYYDGFIDQACCGSLGAIRLLQIFFIYHDLYISGIHSQK